MHNSCWKCLDKSNYCVQIISCQLNILIHILTIRFPVEKNNYSMMYVYGSALTRPSYNVRMRAQIMIKCNSRIIFSNKSEKCAYVQ